MFYALTGFFESEVLGNNCRFLQAPGGAVVSILPLSLYYTLKTMSKN